MEQITKQSVYKKNIDTVDKYLHTLRSAAKRDPQLQAYVEHLSNCLEELRSTNEELIARDRELARATIDLQNEHKRYRDLFEFSPDGYVITDAKGMIVEANLVAARMFGVRHDHLVRTPLFVFFRESTYELLKQLSKEKERSKIHKLEAMVFPRKRRAFYAQITSSAIYDAGGKPTGLRLLMRDVSEAKLKEQRLEESHAELRALAKRLEEIREEERNNLARELHDEFGAALTALKLDLAWLTTHVGSASDAVRERINGMSKLIDLTTHSISRTATMLRPPLLDDFGLVAAIEWQAQEFQGRTGITCSVTADQVELPPDRATAVFRIFQECLTNVARHADASEVDVRLSKGNGEVILEVQDNGRGVPEEKLSSRTSFGLLGMRERAYAFGGKTKIESSPGMGATVRVWIPSS